MDGHIEAARGRFSRNFEKAFTLIEMILVVAVIGIMTSLVIAAVTNSSADARRVIARQQQATIQEALNAWIAKQPNITAARASYNGAGNVTDKLTLIQGYLDTNSRWYSDKTFVGGNLVTPNMQAIGASVSFSTNWVSGSSPTVLLQE